MAAPTLVASYATSYTTASTSKNVTVTCQAGDTLVVSAMGQINTAQPPQPTANGITFDTVSAATGSATQGSYILCVAQNISVAGSVVVTMTESTGTLVWGFTCSVVRKCCGWKSLFNSSSASGAPSLGATVQYPDSAIIALSVDGSAQDGTTRTWRTVNGITPSAGNGLELTYANVPGAYTAYAAYYSDTGTSAGTKFIGLTAPGGQAYSIAGVELVGGDTGVMLYSRLANYAATTIQSTTITIGDGSRRLVIVIASVGVQPANGTDSSVTTTATIAGVSMQSIAKVHSNNGTQGYVEMFYSLSIPIGNPAITVTSSSTVDLAADIYVFNNVNQENAFTISTAYGSSTSASTTFSGTTSRSIIVGALVSGNNISATANGSPTGTIGTQASQNFNNSSDGGCRARQIIVSPPSSQTVGWTVTNGPWALIAIRINPSTYFAPGIIYGLGL